MIEMGGNDGGEMKRVVEIGEGDWGMIRNVGKGDVEGLGCFEGVMGRKGELYEYVGEKGNGRILIENENGDLNKIGEGVNCVG